PPVSALPLADGAAAAAAAARLRQGFNHVIPRCRRRPDPIPYSRVSTTSQRRNPGLPRRRRRRSACFCSSRRSRNSDEYLHLRALEVQWMYLVPLQDLGPVTLPILPSFTVIAAYL
ncbi:unnamed protein product, partial [Urochloa humidicola]